MAHNQSIPLTEPTQALRPALEGVVSCDHFAAVTPLRFTRLPNFVARAKVPAVAKVVYANLYTYAYRHDLKNVYSDFRGLRRVADETAVPVSTVHRSLAHLNKAGLVANAVEPAAESTEGRARREFFWQGDPTDLQPDGKRDFDRGARLTLAMSKHLTWWIGVYPALSLYIEILSPDPRIAYIDILTYAYIELKAGAGAGFFQSAIRAAQALGIHRHTFVSSVTRLKQRYLIVEHGGQLYPTAHPIMVAEMDDVPNILGEVKEYYLANELTLEDLEIEDEKTHAA